MKTITAKVLTAACALILIVFLTSAYNKKQGETPKKILLVRTTEHYMGGDSKIIIINELGNLAEIELGSFRGEGRAKNGIKINKILNDLSIRGYDLHSTNSGFAESIIHSEYIFIKN